MVMPIVKKAFNRSLREPNTFSDFMQYQNRTLFSDPTPNPQSFRR
jgi:hypothetical protein